MPWTVGDVDGHHKGLGSRAKSVWVEVANSVLAKTGDKGRAIREANSAVNRIRSGGLRTAVERLGKGRHG